MWRWLVDLTPKTYECSTHAKDLTAAVEEKLNELTGAVYVRKFPTRGQVS
jgi:hypothetical protein